MLGTILIPFLAPGLHAYMAGILKRLPQEIIGRKAWKIRLGY